MLLWVQISVRATDVSGLLKDIHGLVPKPVLSTSSGLSWMCFVRLTPVRDPESTWAGYYSLFVRWFVSRSLLLKNHPNSLMLPPPCFNIGDEQYSLEPSCLACLTLSYHISLFPMVFMAYNVGVSEWLLDSCSYFWLKPFSPRQPIQNLQFKIKMKKKKTQKFVSLSV